MSAPASHPPETAARERSAARAGTAPRGLAHALVLALACAAPFAVLALGLALEPDARGFGTHEQLGAGPCPPLARWNLPCPGCGVTTALVHAAQGEPVRALAAQPLGFALALAALLAAPLALVLHRRGRDLGALAARALASRAPLALAFFVAACWLYKIARVQLG